MTIHELTTADDELIHGPDYVVGWLLFGFGASCFCATVAVLWMLS